ncbi:MAG: 2-succinyl-5-enolpyruvyl-6-hydroxy-3-cyclohexene-1-carboxylic-acid synthase [Verrucomicrobiota bacterium]|nr:2-succinyl-5-enolpyruvyl-6-hydroxy-3-cyclohexene-1-carboxylic-acid synthase [Verrucomicrobiota bacterium]
MSFPEIKPFDHAARSNVNSCWGALTMEVLARLGIHTVITSPGSRSTPLTVAAARNPRIEALSILDERSAAFYALGLTKSTGRPVALVCTSGSAAANYWPAVVEASMSCAPLLLFTADRPPELRNCASGQTIDQCKLYGDYVRLFADLGLPEASPDMLAYLRQTIVHAVHISLSANAGPVHLNFPFRDPLAPEHESSEPVVDAGTLEVASTVITRPCEVVPLGSAIDMVDLERLSSHTKGIIVVGTDNPRCGDKAFTDAVALISDKLGWPVIADALNPLRNHVNESLILIARYDAFLRDVQNARELLPTAILQIGSLPTSKVLRAWLSSLDAVSFLLTPRPVNTDPLHRIATPLYGDVQSLAEHLKHQRVESNWGKQWLVNEQETVIKLDTKISSIETLFEGKVAWLLSKHLPINTPIFLASSMSVRHAEYFWDVSSRAHSIFCNRGANGIDGTLSTALGVAHGGKPSVLLTGDLAFLHDSNGLLAASQLKGSLTVVLINNNGGGIFEHLPVSQIDSSFEDFFVTPQSVDLANLCEAHCVHHQQIQDWDDFIPLIEDLPEFGLRILELRTDRKADQVMLSEILKV